MKINNKKPNVFKYLFFFSILTPLLINCTRKSSETSAIKLAVPTQQFKTNSKTGSLATQKLTFAAANVRVKGDAKPFFSKNYNDNDTAATGTTSSIEWVVENPPAGKNLYIQVLAVYEDMTTEQEEIN